MSKKKNTFASLHNFIFKYSIHEKSLRYKKNASIMNYSQMKAELTQSDTGGIVPRNNEELFLTRHWP